MVEILGEVNKEGEIKIGFKEWQYFDRQKGVQEVFQEKGIKVRKEYFGSGFGVVEYGIE